MTEILLPENPIEAFTADYIARKNELISINKQERAWEAAMEAKSYVMTSSNPAQINQFYAADETRDPLPYGPVTPDRQQEIVQGRRNEFVTSVEDAYAANREEIPISLLLEYSPEELRLFTGDNLINFEGLARAQAFAASHAELRKRADEEINKRYENYMTGREFFEGGVAARRALDLTSPLTGRTGGSFRAATPEETDEEAKTREDFQNEVWLEFTGQRDKLFEDQIQARLTERRKELRDAYQKDNESQQDINFITTRGTDRIRTSRARPDDEEIEAQIKKEEEQMRMAIINGGDPADALKNPKNALQNLMDGALGGFAWGIDKLFTVGGGALWAVDQALPGSNLPGYAGMLLTPYDYMRERNQKSQQEAMDQYDELIGSSEEQYIQRAAQVGLEQAWQQMPNEDPEVYQQWLDMAGGDEAMAFGFFGSAVTEAPEVEQQLLNLADRLRQEDEQQLEELREQDFRFSHEMLDLLSVYGRNVPGRFATSFTLLLSDQDYWDDLTTGQFKKVWNEVGDRASKNDFTPSAVIGIDGSMLGLALDLGMGISFDPTTYFLGPRFLGAVKGTAVSSVDDAARIVRSAPVRAMQDDIINFAQSPGRGMAASYHLMGWMDSAYIGRIMELVGWNPKVLPKAPWKTHATGKGAMEVRVDFLRRFTTDEQIAATGRVTDESLPLNMTAEKRLTRNIGLEEVYADAFISSLGDDILRNGFKEAGEITISRYDNTIHLSDGVARLLAAEERGISHMPVRLKVVDEPSFGAVGSIDELDELGVVPVKTESLRKFEDVNRDLEPFRQDMDEFVEKMGREGFDVNQPILVQYNRALDQILVTDGNHRLAAAARNNFDEVPVVFDEVRVDLNVDRSSKATTPVGKLSELFPEVASSIRRVMPSSGQPLDGILEGGFRSLKKAFKSIDEGAGEVFMRPDRLIPGSDLLGKVDKAKLNAIVEEAVMNGNRPWDGARTVALTSVRGRFREAVKQSIPEEIRSFFTSANTTTRMDYHGPGHMNRIVETAYKMWGDDAAKADEWIQKFVDHQTQAARVAGDHDSALAALLPLREEVISLMDLTGGAWDDAFRLIDDELASLKQGQALLGDAPGNVTPQRISAVEAQKKRALLNREEANRALHQAIKKLDRAAIKTHKALETLPDQRQLHKLVKEMWDDYNRTVIVPRWQKQIAKNPDIFDTELGIVKWEHLKRGKVGAPQRVPGPEGGDNWLPETLADQAKAAGIENPERMARMLNNILETPMSGRLELSPLEMIAAGTMSGAKWTRWTQTAAGNAVREATHALHKAWVVDKVLRPATAMTVSGDELLRIFHESGRWGVGRYLSDRALFLNARIQHLMHGGNPLGRDAVRKGARYSERVQNRLRRLDEYTMRHREWERIFYDDHGLGWSDIMTDDPIYRDAAKQWTGGMIQQSGFRAFLRGKDDFAKWYLSVDGEALRNATLMRRSSRGTAPASGVMASVDEAYKGWETMFNKVILKKAKDQGVYDEVLQAFKETAEQVDALGGKAVDLPDWVFAHMGPVRGTQKHNRMRMSPLRMTDAFFDRFFLDPVNYRRGFVADMVAQTEKARLEALFASQKKVIMSDVDIAHALGYKGLANMSRTGVKDFITEQALKRDMVPQSYVDDLVQRAADKEMDHMLYVADQGRRIGNVATGTLFPFGKPYADMMGFWGREMLRRPHFRGLINEDNANILGDILTAKGMLNPRTPALVSRLASTDFTIDQGWAGGLESGETAGLIPGSEKTDLDPLLFLPTGGENPFYSLIPGMGYIPMWGLDMLLTTLGDPMNDPEGYQALVDAVGDVIPGAFFGNPHPGLAVTQRFLGGGTFGQAAEVAMDVYALFGDSGGFGPVSTILGQPDREIDRGRMASAILSNPEEWDALFELEDEEAIALYIDSLAMEADEKAAKGNLSEQISRFVAPATSKFSGELDQIYDVWITAGSTFPELAGVADFDADSATPEERRQYADSIRSAFFDLPPTKRDRYIVEQPTLAVNLISTWDWTDYAEDRGIAGTEIAYRTDGSKEGLTKHDLYIKQGFIRPLSPQERIRRIIGVYYASKESTAKRIYEEAASDINEARWEFVVSPQTKASLESFLEDQSDLFSSLGIETPRELWEGWSRYQEELEQNVAEDVGIPQIRSFSQKKKEQTAYDLLRKSIKVPSDELSWGTTWPGVNPDELSRRYENVVFNSSDFTTEMQELADAVGVQLTDGMTGKQLYNGVQRVVTSTATPLAMHVNPAYETYIGSRSVVGRVVSEQLRNIAFDPRYNEEWRDRVRHFTEFVDNTKKRYSDSILGVPPAQQLAVQTRYMEMMNTANDSVITDWQQLWDKGFARSFGELGWTPPEPLNWKGENGEVIDGAYQPFIKRIVDGDSLVVSNSLSMDDIYEVRLLGVRARDFGLDDEGAIADKERLSDALEAALENGDRIYLVRQPDTFGNVDIYGRELAWLWIGETPFYFSEEMLPNRDPSGGGS